MKWGGRTIKKRAMCRVLEKIGGLEGDVKKKKKEDGPQEARRQWWCCRRKGGVQWRSEKTAKKERQRDCVQFKRLGGTCLYEQQDEKRSASPEPTHTDSLARAVSIQATQGGFSG